MINNKTASAACIACLLATNVGAEITGSGLLDEECDGELEFNLWIDANSDGYFDSSEPVVPNVNLTLSKLGSPELGVESVTADSSGFVRIESLCEGEYGLSIDNQSLPTAVTYSGAFESGAILEITGSGLLGDNAVAVELADGENGNAPEEREIDLAFEVVYCEVEAVASCGTSSVAEGEPEDYQCDKPVSELSFVWNGAQAVRVVAHAGKLDKPVVADFDRVVPGQVVTVAGLQESGSDIIWELYEAGTDNKIGESNFHVSCSDEFMDGPEDCGLPAGDGKNDDKCTDSCINDWLFAGLIDKNNTIQCLPGGEMTSQASCEVYPDDAYAIRYQVTNNTTQTLGLNDIAQSGGAYGSNEIPLFASEQQVEFAVFGQATDVSTHSLTAEVGGSDSTCAVEASTTVAVMELPPACDSVQVELRDLGHDKFKLRFTNEGDRELVLTGYELSWPQENEMLIEVKWDGDKLFDQELSWQLLTVHAIDDFLLGPAERRIPAEDHVEVEFKFDEHVHNSPQLYDVEFDFDTDCSIGYSITP